MHILIAVAAGVALLYFWLSGHWFARVVMFLVLAVLMGLGMAAIFAVPHEVGPSIVGAILGVALAWPASGIPIYYQRHQFNKWLRQPG